MSRAPLLPGPARSSFDEFTQWIPRGADVAIVDVPVHRNVGDLFILAATHHLLADRGCRVVYAAGVRDYKTDTARRAVTPTTVVLGLGGGNFGDLYPKYQALRERVVADFSGPSHRRVPAVGAFPRRRGQGSERHPDAPAHRLADCRA